MNINDILSILEYAALAFIPYPMLFGAMLDAAKPLCLLSRRKLLQSAAVGLTFGMFSFSQAAPAKASGAWSAVAGDRHQFEMSSAELRPWAAVLARHGDEDVAAAAASACPWRRMCRRVEGFEDRDSALAVQRATCQIPYRSDISIYGANDYWATPRETLKRGGACEDFAILRFLMLRASGSPHGSVKMIIVTDQQTHLQHAVTGLQSKRGLLLLDNLAGEYLIAGWPEHYYAHYMVDEKNWTIFFSNGGDVEVERQRTRGRYLRNLQKNRGRKENLDRQCFRSSPRWNRSREIGRGKNNANIQLASCRNHRPRLGSIRFILIAG